MKIEKIDSSVLCECCGDQTAAENFAKRGYSLRRCLNCGLIFVWPQPSSAQLKTIYSRSQGYFGTAATDLTKTTAEPALRLHALLQRHHVNKGRLLDIGCSTGKLIFHLQKLGYTVAGCDVNAEAVEIAVNNGLDAQVGAVEMIDYVPESFDIIHMGDVLEHLTSPARALQTAHRLLKPDGVIVIVTPNCKSSFAVSTRLLSKITGFPWPHSEAPYHLFEFSPTAIQQLLKRNGFKLLTMDLSGKVPFLYTVGSSGFFDDLKWKLKAQGKYKLTSSIVPYLPLLVAITGLLTPFYIYSRVADRLRHTGHVMTVVAKR